MRLWMPGWGPVLEVLEYRDDLLGSVVVRVVLNWRGRPLTVWLDRAWLRVLP